MGGILDFDLAETEEVLRNLVAMLTGDPAVKGPRQTLESALIKGVIEEWLEKFGWIVAGHALFWALLLLAYHRSAWVQTFIFWNPWVRNVFGFPYVGLVLRYVPFVRARLFVPFKERLVADAQLDRLELEHWFPDATVLDLDGRDSKAHRPLREAVPKLTGQLVIIGESGLGKTMFLRELVREGLAAGRILAFLPAEDCGGGVMEALQKRLDGPARDPDFLRDLVYAGAIDVCIDGLNQVPPDTRAKVADFMGQFSRRGNVGVSTQPMDWRAPKLARRYRLEPLAPAKIVEFLQSRAETLSSDAPVHGDRFRKACADFAEESLDESRRDPAEAKAARDVLSNPLDATVAAELIAAGKTPDLLDLRQQQFDAMAASYRDTNGMDFPLQEVAEAAYEMRAAGSEIFPKDKFPRELFHLAEHRILVRRRAKAAGDGTEQEWWTFRHDKFLEFFVVQAFLGEHIDRRVRHFADPPFRGMYLRLARVLPLPEAEALERQLILHGANTNDHSICNRYVQLLHRRKLLEGKAESDVYAVNLLSAGEV